MGSPNSGKAHELTLSKWLSLPISAWSALATIRELRPTWNETLAMKAALEFYAAKLEKEENEFQSHIEESFPENKATRPH